MGQRRDGRFMSMVGGSAAGWVEVWNVEAWLASAVQ